MTILRDNPASLVLDTPLYQRLYTHVRNAILTGDLKPGMKLPATRALANDLNVSRTTVLNAYQQLITGGYLDAVVGRGTFVARILPDDLSTSSGGNDRVVTQPAEPQQPRFSDHATLQMTAPQMSESTPSLAGATSSPIAGIPRTARGCAGHAPHCSL